MSTFRPEKAGLTDLDEVLELFDAVQQWLVGKGLKEQWGDVPFAKSPAQRERFAAWLGAGSLFALRLEGRIVGTLVFSPSPPDYARDACADRGGGGYLEAFAVHRGCAGQGVGAALLSWAEEEGFENPPSRLLGRKRDASRVLPPRRFPRGRDAGTGRVARDTF